ncbi:MAG: HAMP domain-containing histidine kinase [Desulfobacteraceae bacterium]|nr:HAMP domain-containing histidine kinase [Desulfobacteraceae bacterium]
MITGRLYLKILLSFFGILSITLALSLALFIAIEGRTFRDYLDKNAFPKLQIFQEMIQKKIDAHPFLALEQNSDLKKQLDTFSTLFGIKIWISDPARGIQIKTFTDSVKISQKGFHRRIYHQNGITLYHFIRKRTKYYAIIPVKVGDNELRLHLYYDPRYQNQSEGLFFLGILTVGGVVALLIIPLAGRITRRVNRLNRSALEFANGNLSCRTNISGHDEIAKLGHSFNFMADKIEKLIQGSKDLTANVSHELRSPLTRIQVAKELILDKIDKLDKKKARVDIHRYIQNMESDIQSLDTLIDQVLKLSKIDYQESDLSLESFDFKVFLTKELKQYHCLLQQKNIKIEPDIPTPAWVSQDKSVLKSILSNLLDNAIKYTSKNGKILIRSLPVPEKGLIFTVTNTCPPLDNKELKMIFTPFYRTRGNCAPGSGLGLTITKKQVKRCKGQISADNTEEGLAFKISLP